MFVTNRDLSGNGAGVALNNPRNQKNRSRIAGQMTSITPSDSVTVKNQNNEAVLLRAVRATGAGNITVKYVDGRTNVYAVAADTWTEVDGAQYVMSTGTTATGITGVF